MNQGVQAPKFFFELIVPDERPNIIHWHAGFAAGKNITHNEGHSLRVTASTLYYLGRFVPITIGFSVFNYLIL